MEYPLNVREHHEIVYDKEQVEKFLELFPLPDNDPYLCMECVLFARKKYCQDLTKDEHILERVFLVGNKPIKDQVRKLMKLHVPLGCYISSNERKGVSIVIPNDALALYISPKWKDSLSAMGKLVQHHIQSVHKFDEKKRNPLHHFKSLIGCTNFESSRVRKLIQIDFDTKEEHWIQKSREMFQKTNVTKHIVCEVETKNGFHIIYENSKEIDGKTLHIFQKSHTMDTLSANLNPIRSPIFTLSHQVLVVLPGTYQGGFCVKFSNQFH